MFRKPHEAAISSRTSLRNKEAKALRDALTRKLPGAGGMLDALLPGRTLEEARLASRVFVYSDANDHVPIVVALDPKTPLAGRMFPTVYALWRVPQLIPVIVVHSPVSAFIINGADVMLPGVVDGVALPQFSKGDFVAVCVAGNPDAVAVGEACCSDSEARSNGMRGRGVRVLHSYRDELWALGGRGEPNAGFTATHVEPLPGWQPREADAPLSMGAPRSPVPSTGAGGVALTGVQRPPAAAVPVDATERVVEGLGALQLVADAEPNRAIRALVADPPVPVAAAVVDATPSHGGDARDAVQLPAIEPHGRPSPAAAAVTVRSQPWDGLSADELFQATFIQALRRRVRASDLPLLPAVLLGQHMRNAVPSALASAAAASAGSGNAIDPRHTRWKKFGVFLAEMAAVGVIQLAASEGTGSATIVDVARDHELITRHRGWPATAESGYSPPEAAPSSAAGAGGAVVDGPVVREYFRCPPAARPIFAWVAARSMDASPQPRRPAGTVDPTSTRRAALRRPRLRHAVEAATAAALAAVATVAASGAVTSAPAEAASVAASGSCETEDDASADDASSAEGSGDDRKDSGVADDASSAEASDDDGRDSGVVDEPDKSTEAATAVGAVSAATMAPPTSWLALLDVRNVLYTRAESNGVLSSYVALRGLGVRSDPRLVGLDTWLADVVSPSTGRRPHAAAATTRAPAAATTRSIGADLAVALRARGLPVPDEPPPAPTQPLPASQCLSRDDLAKTWIDRMVRHAVSMITAPVSAGGGTRVQAGPPPRVRITLKTVQGRKHATHVEGLDAYGIALEPVARDAARMLAASASVQPCPSNPSRMEVVVQGHAAAAIAERLMTHWGVPRTVIDR